MANVKKIPTMVAMPITPQQNQMFFSVQESVVDLSSSYVELQLELDAGITNTNGICLSRDGLLYPPSSLFRQSKLTNKSTGKVLQDLNYVNILDANMKHYSQGALEKQSLGNIDGGAVVGPDLKAYSIFSNDYADPSGPVLFCPLADLFPGSLGQSDVLPLGDGESEFRFLMEPQFKVLGRVVNSEEYETVAGQPTVSTGENRFSNVSINSTTVSASALGVIANYSTGDKLLIFGQESGASKVFFRNITGKVADDGATAGNFTVNTAFSATNAISQVNVFKTANNTNKLACNPIESSTSTLTLVSAYPANKDLWVGTEIEINYSLATSNLEPTADVITHNIVKRRTVANFDHSTGIITLNTPITLASNEGAFNLYCVPLYTNIESDWKITSAHLILVSKPMKIKPQSMVVQNFESVNVQCVPGSSRFMYNYKVSPNTYNVWCIQPTDTNLYGVAHDINKYLYTLNERPLTTLQIQTSSSIHQDNLGRCFANSPVYKLKNLRNNRDREILSESAPIMLPGKLFNAVMNGEDNLQPEGMDRNLRLELLPTTTTENTTVFLFMEKHQVI